MNRLFYERDDDSEILLERSDDFSFELPSDKMQEQIFASLTKEEISDAYGMEEDILLKRIEKVKHEIFLLEKIAIDLKHEKDNAWNNAIKESKKINPMPIEKFIYLKHRDCIKSIDLSEVLGEEYEELLSRCNPFTTPEMVVLGVFGLNPNEWDDDTWTKVKIKLKYNMTIETVIQRYYENYLRKFRNEFCAKYTEQVEKKYNRCICKLNEKKILRDTLIRKLYHTVAVDTSSVQYNKFNIYPDVQNHSGSIHVIHAVKLS